MLELKNITKKYRPQYTDNIFYDLSYLFLKLFIAFFSILDIYDLEIESFFAISLCVSLFFPKSRLHRDDTFPYLDPDNSE